MCPVPTTTRTPHENSTNRVHGLLLPRQGTSLDFGRFPRAGLSAKSIIEAYAERWPLEVTFHECKGRLGFEDPQNRLEHAVERTAPMALWAYSLVVLWYVKWGQHTRAARLLQMPWYPSKAAPAFSDRLATLRRASWLERLSVPCHHVPTLRKVIRPILEYVAA